MFSATPLHTTLHDRNCGTRTRRSQSLTWGQEWWCSAESNQPSHLRYRTGPQVEGGTWEVSEGWTSLPQLPLTHWTEVESPFSEPRPTDLVAAAKALLPFGQAVSPQLVAFGLGDPQPGAKHLIFCEDFSFTTALSQQLASLWKLSS